MTVTMKISYQPDDWGPQFDDSDSCQIYERIVNFIKDQGDAFEWKTLIDVDAYSDLLHLKRIVENFGLFRELMDEIIKAEAEL